MAPWSDRESSQWVIVDSQAFIVAMVRASQDAKIIIVLITVSQRSVAEAFELKAGSSLDWFYIG